MTIVALSRAIPGSMIGGMTMVRKTVTLDAKAVEAATELAGGNLSAYVNDALVQQVRRDKLRAFVEEYRRRYGTVSPERASELRASLAAVEAVPLEQPPTGPL